jgi:hypothetical protein
MIPTNDTFNKYKLLLESITWKILIKYKLPMNYFEDLQSLSYLAFCQVVNKFDVSKMNCFTTYLYPSVKGILMDYCRKELYTTIKNERSKEITWFDFQIFHEVNEKINTEMLSPDAKEIIKYIVSFEWHNPEGTKRIPRKRSVYMKFQKENNWPINRTLKAWEEIKSWWNKEAVYG